jgi:hypothetical protein
MDSLVITLTALYAGVMTLAAVAAVAAGQFAQPIPIKVEEDSQH